jgi:flagellar biosynthesis/type III secretory pathway M-ring protein FliF/YscJ
VADDARSALAEGDLDEAGALADTVTERAGWAVWLGLAVLVLALALLAGTVRGVVGLRRRRRARAAQAAEEPADAAEKPADAAEKPADAADEADDLPVA